MSIHHMVYIAVFKSEDQRSLSDKCHLSWLRQRRVGGVEADTWWQQKWMCSLGDWPWVKWEKSWREEIGLCGVTDWLPSSTQPPLSIFSRPGAPISCYSDSQVELQRNGALSLLTQQTTGPLFIPHFKRHRMLSPSVGPPQCLLCFWGQDLTWKHLSIPNANCKVC